MREVPTQLSDFVAPIVKTYSLETVVAEKLDAILDLMELSSRMKDYYDLYLLSIEFNFEGDRLRTALSKTFKNRDRAYSKDNLKRVLALDQNKDMLRKWDAFLKKSKLSPIQFDVVLAGISAFLEPVWNCIHADKLFDFSWNPQDGQWVTHKLKIPR